MGLPPPGLDYPERDEKFHGIHPAPLQCWMAPEGDEHGTCVKKQGSQDVELDWEAMSRRNGKLGLFVHSPPFQNLTLAVIVLNGLWIGIDVQWNHFNLKENGKLPLDPMATVIENLFCTYFTLELILRFLAFKKKVHCFQDSWFFFDSSLVILMVLEIWVLVIVDAIAGGAVGGSLSKFSALRLIRLARLSRLFKSLPELLTLIKGMINATRAVATVLSFMVLIMYVFSIVFTVSIGDSKAGELTVGTYWDAERDPTSVDLFGSIGDSMMTLFTRGVLGDNLAETLEAIKDRGGKEYVCTPPDSAFGDEECARTGGSVWLMWIFIIFCIISAFCLFNMIVGILCAVIDETSKEEIEAANTDDVTKNLTQVFTMMDSQKDGVVTKVEWNGMKQHGSVRSSLIRIGMPEESLDEKLMQLEKTLFTDELEDIASKDEDHQNPSPDTSIGMAQMASTKDTGLELAEFLAKITENRADKDASRLDVEVLHARVKADERSLNLKLGHIEEMLSTLKQKVFGQSQDPPTSETKSVAGMMTAVESKLGHPLNSSTVWLQGIPTEALFSALQRRARQKPKPIAGADQKALKERT